MKSLSVGVFAVAALLAATPLSLRCSQDNGTSLSIAVDRAEAADMSVPARHHRAGYRHGYRYSGLYHPYCNGPYTGGGWNGGTYYGGPWMDFRCYGAVYPD
jgi:hypothetical protein